MKIFISKLWMVLLVMILLSMHSENLLAQRRVTVIRTLPAGARVHVHSGVRYSYYNGVYYKPYRNRFVVVRPPLGIRVGVLPPGFVRMTIAGAPYFYAGGVYYVQKGPELYEVVKDPH